MTRSIGAFLALLVAVSIGFSSTPAFAGSRMPEHADDSVAGLPVIPMDQVATLADVLEQADDARVVLVGETHTRYDHHEVQLEILKHLHRKSPNLALGVEWFQQPFQQHLDDFIAGDITEKEMLERTEYFDRWSYDYRLYRPIIQYAREQEIPIIALNASRELMKALRESVVEDLPDELKAQAPEEYDWSDEAYAARLRETFDLHPQTMGDFDDFLRGQLTWDESMAERAVRYLQENPENRMLVLAGSGHIIFGSGIPNRIQRRMKTDLFTILVSEDYLPMARDMADYLVLSPQKELAPVGLIGALLANEGRMLVIRGFSDNSAVQDAGVPKGAAIVGIDDVDVETLGDFKLAIMDRRQGDTIKLHYIDEVEAGKTDRKSVDIELR